MPGLSSDGSKTPPAAVQPTEHKYFIIEIKFCQREVYSLLPQLVQNFASSALRAPQFEQKAGLITALDSATGEASTTALTSATGVLSELDSVAGAEFSLAEEIYV